MRRTLKLFTAASFSALAVLGLSACEVNTTDRDTVEAEEQGEGIFGGEPRDLEEREVERENDSRDLGDAVDDLDHEVDEAL